MTAKVLLSTYISKISLCGNIKSVGLRHDSRRHKLLPKYWVPFKMLEVIGANTVRLDMPAHRKQIHPVVSVQLIKPFKQRKHELLPPVIVNGELEFEVETIVDFNIVKLHRKSVPSVVEFRVRWQGSCEDSWHEPCDFENAQDALEAYLSQLTLSRRKSVLKCFDPDSLQRLPAHLRS